MKKVFLAVLVACLVAGNAFGMGPCPNNFAPLPSNPQVCVPAHKNITRIDKAVNRCVAHGMTRVKTEYAAENLAKTCASLILGGQDWRRAF